MDCFGTYLTHVQTRDVTRVQSATEWTAAVYLYLVFKVLRNGLLRYIYFTHVQTCDLTRVQSATEWTASVYILHTCSNFWSNSCSKCYGQLRYILHTCQTCDATRVQSAIRNGLLRYILHTCPNLWCNSCSKCYTEWTASVQTSHMSNLWCNSCSKCYGLLRYILHTWPNLWCNSCSKCYGMDCFGTYCTHVQTCEVTRVQSATECTASVQ